MGVVADAEACSASPGDSTPGLSRKPSLQHGISMCLKLTMCKSHRDTSHMKSKFMFQIKHSLDQIKKQNSLHGR